MALFLFTNSNWYRASNNFTGNSGHYRPPSTDGFKRPQKKRKRTGKLPGGQEGHEGHTLEWCENPDIIKTYRVPFCEGCGASLEGVPAKSVDEREDYDIPEPQIIVTKHIAETVVCPRCGQSHKGSFPADISAHLQYGPNIRALMVYLCTYQLLPYERAAEIFSDLYGCSPVKATLMKSISDCATNLEGFLFQSRHISVNEIELFKCGYDILRFIGGI